MWVAATLGEEPELLLRACGLLKKPRATNRVLGGSTTAAGTLQRQERDVVLLLPAFPNETMELLQK